MIFTDFELYLCKAFEYEKNLSKRTLEQYIKNLRYMNEDEPVYDLDYLAYKDTIVAFIQNNYAVSTQRNFYITIVSVLKLVDLSGMLLDFYENKMYQLSEQIIDIQNDRSKSDKQKANWMSWNEVRNKYHALERDVLDMKNYKIINCKDYSKLLECLVLSLYIYIPPRRNRDFIEMNIIKGQKMRKSNCNYCNMTTKKFHFNSFKNSKSTGSVIINIPDAIMTLINMMLYYRGLDRCKIYDVAFLVKLDADNTYPLCQDNAITEILNKIFKPLKISSSMLRKIHDTDKYGSLISEMEDDSINMSNSIPTKLMYYIKK